MGFDDWLQLATFGLGVAGLLAGVVMAFSSQGGELKRHGDRLDRVEERLDDHDEELEVVTRLEERMVQVQESNKRIEAQNIAIWRSLAGQNARNRNTGT